MFILPRFGLYFKIINMLDKKQTWALLLLRFALGISMLSAVADRLGLWGKQASWGNWENFELYTQKLTFFLPQWLSHFSAYAATFLEIIGSFLLIIGFKIKWAAYSTSILMLIFAVSMTLALGPKAPLDYSVWIGSAAAFLLATQHQYPISIDDQYKPRL